MIPYACSLCIVCGGLRSLPFPRRRCDTFMYFTTSSRQRHSRIFDSPLSLTHACRVCRVFCCMCAFSCTAHITCVVAVSYPNLLLYVLCFAGCCCCCFCFCYCFCLVLLGFRSVPTSLSRRLRIPCSNCLETTFPRIIHACFFLVVVAMVCMTL